MSSDPKQSFTPEAALSDSWDRGEPPARRLPLSILLWAWIVFWLFGFVSYIVDFGAGTLSLGLSLLGIGICVVAEVLALFVGDVRRGRTRWRLRRRIGHRPSANELRVELWRVHDGRRGALAKIERAGRGAASNVGAKIDQAQEERASDKMRRSEEVEKRSAGAAGDALQRYKRQRPGGTVDETQIQFRSYTSQVAYRDDSFGLVAAGWYEQADPTLRYTIARDGFIVIMWRHSSWQRPVNG